MMNTKLTLSALFAACLLTTPVTAKEWKTVRFGVEGAYPPFSWTDASGEIKGFDIDLANALCQQMAVKCELVAQDWDGMIPALLSRKYDAIIAAMSITDERRKKVDFTAKYAHIPNRFVAAKGTTLELTPAGIAGKRIGVQRATTHDKYLTDNFGSDVTIVRYGNADEAYLDLKAGRVLALLADASAIDQGLLSKAGGEKFEYVGPALTDRQWFGDGMGIAVRKGDQDLKAKLDEAIKTLRANGKYQEINQKYFKYDIYGG
ncbi:ABC transporter substrate-binding protein [Aeromonas rivipollensis]|uniref:ABC transporter substrate-binding protein n=1 Tax=Aeromonas rivipollensis TaxID=948519 RepID=UPI0030CABAFA